MKPGYRLIPNVLDPDRVAALIDGLSRHPVDVKSRRTSGGAYAMRNLLRFDAIGDLSRSPALRQIVEPILGVAARPVRGILFDKTPGANWKVAGHQDLSIAVKQRIDVPGFGPWSIKAGVHHVQPPLHTLEYMLTARLHLDDCHEDNGPLRVLPGSHADGMLSPQQIADWRARVCPVDCPCDAGGAVLMRPLILHASSEAKAPGHRRVIHIEYAATKLPGGLEWAED